MGERALKPAFAIGGAVVVAVGVILVILLFGIRQPPSYPRVGERPDSRLAGRIAYVRQDDRRSCVVAVALPAGTAHDVVCGDRNEWTSESIWWSSAGLDVVRYDRSEYVVVTYDPATGSELARRPETPDRGPGEAWPTTRAVDGAEVTVHVDDGSVHVDVTTAGKTRTILSARGPRDYSMSDASWSPDGGWVMVTDSENRILLVSATTPSAVRVLATDAYAGVWAK